LQTFAPVFRETKTWEAFRKELFTWRGTPYRHLQCTKGKGADCSLFLADVLTKVGFMTGIPHVGYYSKYWYIHSKTNHVMQTFVTQFIRHMVSGYSWKILGKEVEPERGDFLLFSLRPVSNVVHHCSIFLGDGDMFHGTVNQVFTVTNFNDSWRKFLVHVCRLGKVEETY